MIHTRANRVRLQLLLLEKRARVQPHHVLLAAPQLRLLALVSLALRAQLLHLTVGALLLVLHELQLLLRLPPQQRELLPHHLGLHRRVLARAPLLRRLRSEARHLLL